MEGSEIIDVVNLQRLALTFVGTVGSEVEYGLGAMRFDEARDVVRFSDVEVEFVYVRQMQSAPTPLDVR